MSDGALEALGEVWQYDASYNRLCDIVGLDLHKRRDSRIAQKIFYLKEVIAHKIRSGDTLDIASEIDNLLKGQGLYARGEIALNALYTSLRLQESIRSRDASVLPIDAANDEVSRKLKDLDEKIAKAKESDTPTVKTPDEGRNDTALRMQSLITRE